MATASGTEDLALKVQASVEDRLFAEPYRFEFVQAVRLLKLFYPNRSRIGLFQPPASECVRIGVVPVLTFPASQIAALKERRAQPPLMRVNFMGVEGPLGVLPLYYTEYVQQRLTERDETLLDFLDIFNHRAISLFYRAWSKYRFPVAYETGEGDVFSQYLRDLIGLGTAGLQRRQIIEDQALLFYAGLIAQQPHSAEALTLILEDYFDVPVRVEQFLGAWYRLDTDSQCQFEEGFPDSQQLGFGAIVGDEIWDPQSRVRIVIGPLALRRYLDFLPPGSAFRKLRSIVNFFGGEEFDFEVQLVLKREEVPPLELGATGEKTPLLGWVSWSSSRKMEYNPSQTILQI